MTSKSNRDHVRRVATRNVDDGKPSQFLANHGHRRTVGMMGECVLCGVAGPLLLGHIVPRWALRLFSGGPITTTSNGQKQFFQSQGGGAEYLLCASCEQHLGVAENYLAALCRGTANDLASIRVQLQGGGLLHGLNERLIMRGLLGIILKAHFSEADLYRSVRIDWAFVPSLKRQILSDAYPAHLYNTHVIKWFNMYGSGLLPRDHSGVSMNRTSDSVNASITIAGMAFMMYFRWTPGVLRTFPIEADFFLAAHRPWNVLIGDVTDDKFFSEVVARKYVDLPHEVNVFDLPPDKPCICGISPDVSYGECCLRRWFPSSARIAGALYDPRHRCPRGDDSPRCEIVTD